MNKIKSISLFVLSALALAGCGGVDVLSSGAPASSADSTSLTSSSGPASPNDSTSTASTEVNPTDDFESFPSLSLVGDTKTYPDRVVSDDEILNLMNAFSSTPYSSAAEAKKNQLWSKMADMATASKLTASQLSDFDAVINCFKTLGNSADTDTYLKASEEAKTKTAFFLNEVDGDQIGLIFVHYAKIFPSTILNLSYSPSSGSTYTNEVLDAGIAAFGDAYPAAKTAFAAAKTNQDANVNWQAAIPEITLNERLAVVFGRFLKIAGQQLLANTTEDDFANFWAFVGAGYQAHYQVPEDYQNDMANLFHRLAKTIGSLRFDKDSLVLLQSSLRQDGPALIASIKTFFLVGMAGRYYNIGSGINKTLINAEFSFFTDLINKLTYEDAEAVRHLVYALMSSLTQEEWDTWKKTGTVSGSPAKAIDQFYQAAFGRLSKSEKDSVIGLFATMGITYQDAYNDILQAADVDFSVSGSSKGLVDVLTKLGNASLRHMGYTDIDKYQINCYLSNARTILQGSSVSTDQFYGHASKYDSTSTSNPWVEIPYTLSEIKVDTSTLGYHDDGTVKMTYDNVTTVFTFSYVVKVKANAFVPYTWSFSSYNLLGSSSVLGYNIVPMNLDFSLMSLYSYSCNSCAVIAGDVSKVGWTYLLVKGISSNEDYYGLLKVYVFDFSTLTIHYQAEESQQNEIAGYLCPIELQAVAYDPILGKIGQFGNSISVELANLGITATTSGIYPVSDQTYTVNGTAYPIDDFTVRIYGTDEVNLVVDHVHVEPVLLGEDAQTIFASFHLVSVDTEKTVFSGDVNSSQTRVSLVGVDTSVAGFDKPAHFLFAGSIEIPFTYDVVDPAATETTFEASYAQDYGLGEDFSIWGLEITYQKTGKDGKAMSISIWRSFNPGLGEYTLSGFDSSKLGTYQATLVYKGMSISLTYYVIDKTLTYQLSVVNVPTVFLVGDELTDYSLNARGSYLDHNGETVNASWVFLDAGDSNLTMSGFDSTTAGLGKIMTFTYAGATLQVKYDVYTADEITVNTVYSPHKADCFGLQNIGVQLVFDVTKTYVKDGQVLRSQEGHSDLYTLAPSQIDVATIGQAFAGTLDIDGQKVAFTYDVLAADAISSYSWNWYSILGQAKTEYEVGETIDLGLSEAYYSLTADYDGRGDSYLYSFSFSFVPSEVVVSGFDTTSSGNFTATLTVRGISYSFSYDVK